MAPPTFLSLPLELRHVIYDYAVNEEVEVDICPCKEASQEIRDRAMFSLGVEIEHWETLEASRLARNRRLPLLLTNKQISAEISQLSLVPIAIWANGINCLWTWIRETFKEDRMLVKGVRIGYDHRGRKIVSMRKVDVPYSVESCKTWKMVQPTINLLKQYFGRCRWFG